ncbi:megakaryocyte and platelet inhibitory receptor G6b isoform X1 [Neofelis nebulosa]|uniref:megakaryocyte and platelet inhibitory receptor G6b isoform X1 n=1 Tax=Neofelis nebulosa TaxID=61452 RepID=UPI00272C5C1B|nr:megakaryocyte and platelet inhibitory receptor G6b isoform X1 [Neofelis nebulosa]
MALLLQLLPVLLARVQGDPGASLDGRPGDRVNFSCVGVSHPIRWAWAPSFPACRGLSKGRRPILWASSSGTPTVSPVQPFAGRLRALDPSIRRLELLLSAGDSGTFFCRGRREEESRTVLHVLGDGADCRAPGPAHGSMYPQLLIPLLGAGLVLGLGALGVVWWWRSCWVAVGPEENETKLMALKDSYTSVTGDHPCTRLNHSPDLLCPPHIDPLVKVETQRPAKEEEPKITGDLDQEPSLLYADLDHLALRRPLRLTSVVPADASTIYAVVV